MLSNKPYLIRAFYDWIVDSGCTPILIARADYPQCVVPQDYVENGEIVLNISPIAIRDLNVNGQVIQFKTSFSSIIQLINVPIEAVAAIYADENGQGLFFDEDSDGVGDMGANQEGPAPTIQAFNTNDAVAATTTNSVKVKPNLKLVE